MKTNDPVRILLVDDSRAFLRALSQFLQPHPHLQIIGCAGSGAEAVRMVVEHSPDLVILDLVMPGMNGLTTARAIKGSTERPPKIVLVTLYEQQAFAEAAEEAGADAFLSKAGIPEGLMPTLERLLPRPTSEPSPAALP